MPTDLKARPALRKALDRTNPMGSTWVLENPTLEGRIRAWAVYSVMKQRGIKWEELAEEFGGVSKARVDQILRKMHRSEVVTLRVDRAITAITDRRHAAECDCADPSCPVYTTVESDPFLRAAKKGAMAEWRVQNVRITGEALSTVHMPTAS